MINFIVNKMFGLDKMAEEIKSDMSVVVNDIEATITSHTRFFK